MGLEKTLMVFGIFAMLLTAYGASTAGLDLVGSLNGIFAPVSPPAILFQNPKGCSFFDVACNAANVAQATEQVAVAIEYPGILIFTLVGRTIAFVTLINTALFGTLATSATVPFLELFELIILLGAAIEVYELAHPNKSRGGGGKTL
jgi:hypothetical protein